MSITIFYLASRSSFILSSIFPIISLLSLFHSCNPLHMNDIRALFGLKGFLKNDLSLQNMGNHVCQRLPISSKKLVIPVENKSYQR